MTLDTIDVPVPPQKVRQYLRKLDDRGEVYHFDVTGNGPREHLELTLMREGSDDPMVVVLKADGTWSAQHTLIVGEQK